MISLLPFDVNDLVDMAAALSQPERDLYTVLTGKPFRASQVAAEIDASSVSGWRFATRESDLACGGFMRMRPGVLRSWFLAPDRAWITHGRELTDSVRDIIASTLSSGLAHRIETVTLEDRSRARAWYEKIGLTYESTLRGYGISGENAVMYVATRDVEKR